MSASTATASRRLKQARENYITQWGALGSAWGISRTMSRIHALLMVSQQPLNTDEIMAELEISRGNAHSNLKELVAWNLVRSAVRKGERKEHFEAEKDVWKVVQRIVRARKRKELEPVLETLDTCVEQTRGLKDAESKAFRKQLKELQKFTQLGDRLMERVTSGPSSRILPWATRFLK